MHDIAPLLSVPGQGAPHSASLSADFPWLPSSRAAVGLIFDRFCPRGVLLSLLGASHGAPLRWVPRDRHEVNFVRRSLLKLTPRYAAEFVPDHDPAPRLLKGMGVVALASRISAESASFRRPQGLNLGGGGLPQQGSFPGMRCSEHHHQERKPHGAV